jgi:phenylpyruvate tautomerase PptA (4-oxalocrotonate tautomerase family)
MPIVDLELVFDSRNDGALSREQITGLADALGRIFDSRPAGTWLRVRYLASFQYAENNQERPAYPVFVTVLKAQLPNQAALEIEMRRVAAAVASAVGRPEENVHVLYEPRAAGRIGFGGNLVARVRKSSS